MARKPAKTRKAVTAARVARLYRMLKLLTDGSSSRGRILQKLRLNQRGFYRDIEVLRACGIVVRLNDGRYVLDGGFDAALDRLPLPDPRLTLGQAIKLARGRTPAHRALRAIIARITT